MSIQCNTMAEFLDVVAGLVERGLTFEASTVHLMVTLTGGY